jgi:hypothetical protein
MSTHDIVILALSVMHLGILADPAESAYAEIPGRIISVHDGDTFWFSGKVHLTIHGATIDGKPASGELSFVAQIRLLDLSDRRNPRGCWAPELSERGGTASRDSLRRMALGKRCTLIVDLDRAFAIRGRWRDVANLSRMSHMGRYFADAKIAGYQNTLGRRQINAGHAWPTKEQQLRRAA